jgi:Fic family protein
MQIMLHESGLIRKSALPISAGLLSDVAKYFGALTAYRDGDYTKIIEQICLAAIDAVDISRNTVRRFEALHARWEEKVTARKDAVVWRLLDLLLTQPVVDAKYAAEHLGVSDPAARGAIDQLKEAGILKNINRKTRGAIYEASEVTKLFDSFASELGRRR